MILLIGIVLGVLVGAVSGGHLSRLKTVHLRGETAFLVLLVLNVVLPRLSTVNESLGIAMFWTWVAGMAGIACLAFANGRRPGMAMMGVGVVLNMLVIVLNRGMPVSVEVMRAVGFAGDAATTLRGDVFHGLLGEGTRLGVLADILPVPGPSFVRAVMSVGDVVLVSGSAVFLTMAMEGPVGWQGEAPMRPRDSRRDSAQDDHGRIDSG
jgi:hypothetical protein